MNISPEEVEGLLASHPALAKVSVIGYADADMSEKLCAMVSKRRGAAVPGGAVQLPARLEWKTSLPRNAIGKELKRELCTRVDAQSPR